MASSPFLSRVFDDSGDYFQRSETLAEHLLGTVQDGFGYAGQVETPAFGQNGAGLFP